MQVNCKIWLSVHRLCQAFFKGKKNPTATKELQVRRVSENELATRFSFSLRIFGSELFVLLKIDFILYLAIKWMWFWCFIMWFKCTRSLHIRKNRTHSWIITLKRAQREICIIFMILCRKITLSLDANIKKTKHFDFYGSYLIDGIGKSHHCL